MAASDGSDRRYLVSGSSNIGFNQKYDRQIRIWGEHGQAALQRASVCVFNLGPTGTETLKNLVLPGIGSFTVVDGTTVCPSDAGNNFFLPPVSKDDEDPPNRALAAAQALLELNNQVDGAYIAEDPAAFLCDVNAAVSFVRRFSLVIVTQAGVGSSLLQTIADGCEKANVPLLAVRSYGLVGTLRIQVPEMCVLDALQDAAPPDLRLDTPFPALEQFVNSVDLPSITDSTAASHVPFVVLLMKALSSFREATGKAHPCTRAEKDNFVAIVKSLRPPVCPDIAENFDEALKYSNLRLCYADASNIPDEIAAILSDPRSDPDGAPPQKPVFAEPLSPLPVPIRLSNRSSEPEEPFSDGANALSRPCAADKIQEEIASFWLHAAGVRAFFASNGGQLPVSGVVPDMTADTKSYVALQCLYAAKAEKDSNEVLHHVSRIAERRGDHCHFDRSSVRDFCKRLRGIRVIRYRSIKAECQNAPGSSLLEEIEANGATDAATAHSPMSYYVLLRGVDRFHSEHGWYPGHRRGNEEDDLRLLRCCVGSIKSELGGTLPSSLWCDEAEEIMRFSHDELHNVASYLGGVAAQEAVKIITRQFVPINNTMVVSFANMTSSSFVA
jgi:NEDD8-activating enzyme E1 regulatory subunit